MPLNALPASNVEENIYGHGNELKARLPCMVAGLHRGTPT